MIKIERSASLNTVQDLGRTGWRHLGVSVSGAMDPLALRAGNILLGNDENAAAIEIQLFPFRVRFTADTFIALTGANCQARLDGKALPGWWGCPVRQGQVLELSFPRYGARGYLCVAGGIHVPVVLGSRSTALRGSFGGLEGRELTTGDTLDVDTPSRARLPKEGVGIVPPLQAMSTHFPAPRQDILKIRAIPAGEHGLFSADGQRFWKQTWKVSVHSNRTGYRLSGKPIMPDEQREMRSYGLIPGIVQVPPAGEPIIQLSDANTAGGYPKIACVIEEDLWRLGQLRAGQSIQFVECDMQTALSTRTAIERWLARLRTHVLPITDPIRL